MLQMDREQQLKTFTPLSEGDVREVVCRLTTLRRLAAKRMEEDGKDPALDSLVLLADDCLALLRLTVDGYACDRNLRVPSSAVVIVREWDERGRKPETWHAIARLAGVSLGTVSKILVIYSQ